MNFLKGRKQCVRVKNSYSNWQQITSGVWLTRCFRISLSDICRWYEVLQICQESNRSRNTTDMWKLCDWSDEWLLAFSAPKCKAVKYGYIRFNFQYEMRDFSNNSIFLPYVEEERDLVVRFERYLNSINMYLMWLIKIKDLLVWLKELSNV